VNSDKNTVNSEALQRALARILARRFIAEMSRSESSGSQVAGSARREKVDFLEKTDPGVILTADRERRDLG